MEPRRLIYIDNIRWTMVILVLTMHACDTYSPFGNWYYTDRPSAGTATTLFFAVYQSVLQAFFMGLLFFIAGYFTVPSVEAKGAASFMRDRIVRLGIPTLLYMFLIGPLTQYFLSHTWGTGGFAHQWLTHLRDGEWLSETGPMWFCAVLLIFCVVYASAFVAAPALLRRIVKVPSNLKIGGFLVAMAMLTFLVRIVAPENIAVLNVHVGDCLQYILMFVAGTLAYRGSWLTCFRSDSAQNWALYSLGIAAPLLLLLVLLRPSLGDNTNMYNGGLNWISACKCLWEALICIGMSFAIISWYRQRFNRQGMLARWLSNNAFAVYVFHPPVVIALAIALHRLNAPAVSKAALLSLLACLVTFSLSSLALRRIPFLRRVL
jgi:glucans biosynthesis protein C